MRQLALLPALVTLYLWQSNQ